MPRPRRATLHPTTRASACGPLSARAEPLEPRVLLAVGPGLRGDFFTGADFADHVFSLTDAAVDFAWADASPNSTLPALTNFATRWSGQVVPRSTETYTFYTQTAAGDGSRLWVNGRKLIDNWTSPAAGEQSGPIALRAGRRYDLVMEYADPAGTATARLLWSSNVSQPKQVIPASQLLPSDRGSLRVDAWNNLGGTSVADLTADPRYPDNPSAGPGRDDNFELPLNTMQQYGHRWRGYVHAPQTGAYTFHVSGDDTAELYVSNSQDPAAKRRVATLPAPTLSREWDKFPQQRSAPVRLVAGQAYYVELLHKQDSGPGHVAVGWTLPDGRFEGPIGGHDLSPVLPEVRLRVDESAAYERGPAPAQYTLTRDDSVPTNEALYVHYILSGAATSGQDFVTLHGNVPDAVIIPAGQRSATFSITPIDDAVNEPQESLTLTLVPSANYTLGPAASATGRFTLYSDDHIPPGTDVIPPNAAPSTFTYFGSAGTRTVVPVTGMPFTQANRVVTNTRPANVWDMQLQTRNATAIAQNDTLELVFWARNADPTKPSALFQAVVEKAASPYTKSLLVTDVVSSTTWQRFRYAFRAAEAYDATTNRAQLAFQLGYNPQAIEIGGVTLKNYGPTVAPADLQRSGTNYPGRAAADTAWLDAAQDRIDQHRRGNLNVIVRDAAGRPLDGAAVLLRMAEHAFGFGSAVVGSVINNTTDPNADIYRRKVKELFNKVVFENDLKWPGWQSNPNTAITALNWLRANGITDVRGHTLIWPSWNHIPASPGNFYGTINYRSDASKDDSQEEYEAHVAVDGLAAANAWLRNRVLTHITQEAGHASLKGRITDWDVLNEPYTEHDIQDILGREEMVAWFNAARAADPAARLFINDYPSLGGGTHLENYFETVRWLLDRGTPLDGIGFQGHFGSTPRGMNVMLQTLDRFAQAYPELAIQITEFDQESTDEQLQADFLRDFLTLSYSHPSIDAFLMWGFWQNRHWKPEAALWRSDWSIKPNGQQFVDLVFGDWWTDVYGTSDADGAYAARAYAGDYDVTATFGGATRTVRATLSADGMTVEITLPVAAVAARHVFYNNSAFDGRSAAAEPADDTAIDTTKQVLLPGAAAMFANVTGYTKGINGVMFDVAALPADATLTADDFAFRTGKTADRSTWINGPAPVEISVRRGAGASGTDRVTLVWRDYNPRDLSPVAQAVANGWLEVTVKATPRTGLHEAEVFSVGNLIGETGNATRAGKFTVDLFDYARTRAAVTPAAAVTNAFDFNRDGRVNALDVTTTRAARNRTLVLPTVTTPEDATAAAPVPATDLVRRRAAYGAAQ